LNGAAIAAAPTGETVKRLTQLWKALGTDGVFASSIFGQLKTLVSSRTHLHSNDRLRKLIEEQSPGQLIEDLEVPFQCVAVSIETARARWFDRGPVSEAVLASCAVPGLLTASIISTAVWSTASRSGALSP
jgi:NTE family protein